MNLCNSINNDTGSIKSEFNREMKVVNKNTNMITCLNKEKTHGSYVQPFVRVISHTMRIIIHPCY